MWVWQSKFPYMVTELVTCIADVSGQPCTRPGSQICSHSVWLVPEVKADSATTDHEKSQGSIDFVKDARHEAGYHEEPIQEARRSYVTGAQTRLSCTYDVPCQPRLSRPPNLLFA